MGTIKFRWFFSLIKCLKAINLTGNLFTLFLLITIIRYTVWIPIYEWWFQTHIITGGKYATKYGTIDIKIWCTNTWDIDVTRGKLLSDLRLMWSHMAWSTWVHIITHNNNVLNDLNNYYMVIRTYSTVAIIWSYLDFDISF